MASSERSGLLYGRKLPKDRPWSSPNFRSSHGEEGTYGGRGSTDAPHHHHPSPLFLDPEARALEQHRRQSVRNVLAPVLEALLWLGVGFFVTTNLAAVGPRRLLLFIPSLSVATT